MRFLEAIPNDAGYKGNRFDGGQRALEVPADLPWLQRAGGSDHGNPERDSGHYGFNSSWKVTESDSSPTASAANVVNSE
jgi:hypothetical protein